MGHRYLLESALSPHEPYTFGLSRSEICFPNLTTTGGLFLTSNIKTEVSLDKIYFDIWLPPQPQWNWVNSQAQGKTSSIYFSKVERSLKHLALGS